ncbi:unnamed protein product [Effrenium voratum]|nr:unnamed protein product [Effrenium voratum]
MRLSKWISDAGSAAEVFSRTQDGRCDWHVHEPQGCARSMARSSSFISGVPDGDAQSYANASTKSMDSYKSGLDDQDALRGQAKGKMGHAAKGKLGAKAKMRRTEGYWAVPNEKCLKHRSAGDTVAGGATSTAKVKTLMHCPSWLVGNNSP